MIWQSYGLRLVGKIVAADGNGVARGGGVDASVSIGFRGRATEGTSGGASILAGVKKYLRDCKRCDLRPDCS